MNFLKKLFTRFEINVGFAKLGYRGKKWYW